jgi:hypothetical protein
MRNEHFRLAQGHEAAARRHFAFPHEVVDDPSFSLSEKRAILSEWASDACAVESFPTLRWLPGTSFPVTFSAVMDARQWLDRIGAQTETNDDDLVERGVLADFARRKAAQHMEG